MSTSSMNGYSNSIAPDNLTKKQTIICLAVLMVVGGLLRFYKLDFQSLWYDELHSIIPTNPAASISSIIHYCKGDQPPAFFLYLHFFFKFFGYSEYAGRAAAALIGVISIPAVFFLGKECKNSAVGLAAALLTTVNYFNIYYSQELRFYCFALLFSTLSFLFFIRAFKYDRAVDYVIYTFTTAVLLYTHYFGIVIFATQFLTFIALWIFVKVPRSFIIRGLLSGLAAALAFAPWLPVIFSDLGIGAFWIQRPNALFLAEYFYGYLGKDIIAALIFLFAFCLFFKYIKTEVQNEQSKGIITILLLWLSVSYAIPLIRSLTSTPILHIRYTIVTLPAWLIIAGWGLTLLKHERVRLILASILVFSSVANLFFIRKHYTRITKQQFREVAATVKQKNVSGVPVMTTFPWHYSYYFTGSSLTAEPIHAVEDSVTSFWLMPVQTFSKQEIEDEVNKFPEFQIKERYPFNKTEAILMVRK